MISLTAHQTYQKQKISDLIKNFEISSPDFQRQINWLHVEHIYNSIKLCLDNDKTPILSGCLQFAQYCPVTHNTTLNNSNTVRNPNNGVDVAPKTWLIDGNHRFQAYKKLYLQDQYDLDIVTNTIVLQTEDECKDLFNQVNHVHPLQFVSDATLKPTDVNTIVNHFVNQFKQCFKSTTYPRRPCMSLAAFQKCVIDAMQCIRDKNLRIKDNLQIQDTHANANAKNSRLSKVSSENIIQWITDLNRLYCDPQSIKIQSLKLKTDTLFDTYVAKAQEYGFSLGLVFKHNPAWLTDLIESKTVSQHDDLKDTKESIQFTQFWVKHATEINKALKLQVWNNFFGNKRTSSCVFCLNTKITKQNFELIHDCRGPKLLPSVDNLYPSCLSCSDSKHLRSNTFTNQFNQMIDKYFE